MNTDFEDIDKIENTNTHNKTHWRKIYEVIQQEFFEENDIFPKEFLKQWNTNANESHNIQTDFKKKLKRMAMKQILYKQVVMLSWKDLNITE